VLCWSRVIHVVLLDLDWKFYIYCLPISVILLSNYVKRHLQILCQIYYWLFVVNRKMLSSSYRNNNFGTTQWMFIYGIVLSTVSGLMHFNCVSMQIRVPRKYLTFQVPGVKSCECKSWVWSVKHFIIISHKSLMYEVFVWMLLVIFFSILDCHKYSG